MRCCRKVHFIRVCTVCYHKSHIYQTGWHIASPLSIHPIMYKDFFSHTMTLGGTSVSHWHISSFYLHPLVMNNRSFQHKEWKVLCMCNWLIKWRKMWPVYLALFKTSKQIVLSNENGCKNIFLHWFFIDDKKALGATLYNFNNLKYSKTENGLDLWMYCVWSNETLEWQKGS